MIVETQQLEIDDDSEVLAAGEWRQQWTVTGWGFERKVETAAKE